MSTSSVTTGSFTGGTFAPDAFTPDSLSAGATAANTTAARAALSGTPPAPALASFSAAERAAARVLARAFIGGSTYVGYQPLGAPRLRERESVTHIGITCPGKPGLPEADQLSWAALARFPGSGLCAALSGALVGGIVERFQDAGFCDTVNDLLDLAGPNPNAALLRSAFGSADVRTMSATDRARFLGMLAFAAGTGAPTLAQTQALLAALASTQPQGWASAGALDARGGSFSSQMTGPGTALIDLGDGYTLRINQANSELDLIDNATGNTMTIWGDPHMGLNGNIDQFQFKRNVTLNLPDGTKITLQTTPLEGNPNAYLTQNLIIARGSQALVVSDMDQNSTDLGQLSIEQYDGAGPLERLLNPDGTELYLNAAGNGWDVLQDGLYLRPLTEQDLRAGDAAQENGMAQASWDLGVLSGLLAELVASADEQQDPSGVTRR